ncbi:MAG: hypothetical protein ACLFQM_06435 [Fidelibacterota bacterium]
MLKRFVLVVIIMALSCPAIFSKTFTRKAIYKKPETIKPAYIKASEIETAEVTIKIEKLSGKYSRIYIYAVPKEGDEFKLSTYSAGWEIPLHKWVSTADLEKYDGFKFYVNADKGGESLYEAELKLTFEGKTIMEAPVKKPIEVNPQGGVSPAYFPLEDIEGANYITLGPESGRHGKIVVFAFNKKTGDKKIIKTVEPKWNNTYLDKLIDEINRKKYTHLGVTLEKTSDSFSFEKTKYTVTVKSLSQKDLEKREAIVENYQKTNYYIFVINLLGGLLFMKLIYPLFANVIVRFKFLFWNTRRVITGVVLLLWAGVVYLLTLTPLIPHHIYYAAITWAWGGVPLIFSVAIPIAVDAKYNLCKNCGYYGKMDFIDYDMSETTREYSATDGFSTYDAGHETDTTFTDYRGCPKCGNEISASTTVTTGTGRQSLFKKNGKVYRRNSGNIFGSILITFLNPYTWYLIYRKIRLLK